MTDRAAPAAASAAGAADIPADAADIPAAQPADIPAADPTDIPAADPTDTPAADRADIPAAGAADAAAGRTGLGDRLVSLHAVIARLRRECPWDRVQTHATLAPCVLDEAAELAEALHTAQAAMADDPHETATAVEDLVEELGDVLLGVLMNAAIGEQAGTFTLAEVLDAIEAKMRRRHPHVFERDPSAPEPSDDELSAQWQAIKAQERLTRAQRITARRERTAD